MTTIRVLASKDFGLSILYFVAAHTFTRVNIFVQVGPHRNEVAHRCHRRQGLLCSNTARSCFRAMKLREATHHVSSQSCSVADAPGGARPSAQAKVDRHALLTYA